MTTNIPMSTKINELENLNELKEPFSDIKYKDETLNYNKNEIISNKNEDINENINNNINLDDIISNQSMLDNNFINYIKDNSDLDNSNKDPSVHVIAKYYLDNMIDDVFPNSLINPNKEFS